MTEADTRLPVRVMNLRMKKKPSARLLGMVVRIRKIPKVHKSFGWPLEMPTLML